jgi:phosphoenolpyruvate carboxykinase (ATP)
LTIATDAPPKCRGILDNPSREELRELARPDETTTEYGSPAYVSQHRARSAPDTRNTVDGEVTRSDLEMIEQAKEFLTGRELIRVDRCMGEASGFGCLHCRLYVTKPFARLAHMFTASLIPSGDPDGRPDFVTIDIPEWPHGKAILVDPDEGTTYVLGSDYYGEIKKSFLRQTMYRAKELGVGLGLHAGSKLVHTHSAGTGELVEKGFLFFGLSGTGKTSLTCHDFDLDESAGEYVRVRQDDVVVLDHDAFCKGTEGGGFYIKTDGLNPRDQEALYDAATCDRAIFENVWVEEDGKVDFYNEELTSNGRAVVPIEEVRNTDGTIDVDRITDIFFITRNPLVPAIGRLTPDQASVAFMLGESIKTSASDPNAKGEPVRVVGTNPFIVGPKGREGELFREMLEDNPELHCYILNTGKIGEGERAEKIGLLDTVAILRAVARDQIEWVPDEASRLEIPKAVPGVDAGKLHLTEHFTESELSEKLGELRNARRAWLDRFPKFPEELKEAVY